MELKKLKKGREMKETDIIMSGNHPKLILDGIKTRTRRTWGLKEINGYPDDYQFVGVNELKEYTFELDLHDGTTSLKYIKCPYGQVGDRLWVRETCYKDVTETWRYRSDGAKLPYAPNVKSNRIILSSRFMPRWASRILLEITDIRVERVQDITAGDCTKEGILYEDGDYVSMKVFEKFRLLWDSLNAKRGYSWESNPFVWVISLKLMEGRCL